MLEGEDEFETIDLRNTKCDICHLEDDGPVIKCVLNDQYVRCLKGPAAYRLKGIVEAHELCVNKWVQVIEQDHSSQLAKENAAERDDNSGVLSNNRLYKRFKDFLSKSGSIQDNTHGLSRPVIDSESNESITEYLPRKSTSSLDWSIDSFEIFEHSHTETTADPNELSESDPVVFGPKRSWPYFSQEELWSMKCSAISAHLNRLNKVAEDKSKELIDAVQMRDTLRQQTEGQKSTIEQLVHLRCKSQQ